jgi:2-iminobutanoate/2-iminopropanoate deaminase
MSDPLGPYSHAVAMGDTVYVAGQVAIGPAGELVGRGDIQAQARQVYKNLDAVLRAMGSDLGSILKLTVYLTDMNDLPIASQVRQEFMPERGYPASTVLEVSKLAEPDFLIEIEAIACIATDS